MIVKFEPIEEMSNGIVRFYTVKLGNNELSEFERFDEQVFPSPHHLKELRIIYSSIEQMKLRGAKENYFRHEGPADALPIVSKLMMNSNKDDYGIRLYCIRLRTDLVVLLNGGIKTHLDPLQCPNVNVHFNRAISIARKIQRAQQDGFIRILERSINIDEDFDLEI